MSRPPDLPDAVAVPRKRWRIQWIWLVPVVAVLVGVWLAVQAVLSQGPTITISFKTGEGFEAGKTKIKFKDVDIGVVKKVALSKDYKSVVATAELTRDATDMLVDDTRFWVASGRVSRAARYQASARCCRVPSSAWISATRNRSGATTRGWKRRPCSRATCRAASSC